MYDVPLFIWRASCSGVGGTEDVFRPLSVLMGLCSRLVWGRVLGKQKRRGKKDFVYASTGSTLHNLRHTKNESSEKNRSLRLTIQSTHSE